MHRSLLRCLDSEHRTIMRCMIPAARINLGKKIRQLRKKRGYTQDKLAEITGIDYKYIQKIEGKKPPAIRIDTIEKLAKALSVSISKLVDFKN